MIREYKNLMMLPADKLKYPEGSAANWSDLDISMVADAIAEDGLADPILVDENGRILAGIVRYLAACRLGIKEIPCIFARDLSRIDRAIFKWQGRVISESFRCGDSMYRVFRRRRCRLCRDRDSRWRR